MKKILHTILFLLPLMAIAQYYKTPLYFAFDDVEVQ